LPKPLAAICEYNKPMIPLSKVQGVIFDVDDTLLNNYPNGSQHNLHEISRLAAAQEVGRRYGSQGLLDFTLERCLEAFMTAKVHSLQGAVWQMLVMAGEVEEGKEVDTENPLYKEIFRLKDELHEEILRSQGGEVAGATHFVETLAEHGLREKMAIASTACRRDVDIFLDEITELRKYFPENRLYTREKFTNAKPDPEVYNLAFASLGLPDTARPFVLAFEDDPRCIASAKNANLFTCAITTRFDKQSLLDLDIAPDIVAESYAEFEHLLFQNANV